MVTRLKNTIRTERAYDVLSIQKQNINGTTNTRKKRHLPINKRKKRRKKVWLPRRLHIEGRLNEEPRLQRKHRDEHEAKQNKVAPEKDAMSSAKQTAGGYKFKPLVASQQGRANQHEPAYFRLSSPWSFPSRSGIQLHAVVQSWLSLQRSISL